MKTIMKKRSVKYGCVTSNPKIASTDQRFPLSTKQMVFLALMAAGLLVINLIIGGWVIALTGIPMANMIVTAISFGIWIGFICRAMPVFWTWTIFLLVYSILELPTALGGAPGFWPKVPINIITGLVADLLIYLMKYRKWSIFPGFYALILVNTLAFVFFMKLLGLPGVEKLVSLLPIVIPLYWLIGTVGLIVGMKLFERMNKTQMMRSLQVIL